MASEALMNQAERLGEEFVLADAGDLPGLSSLHTLLTDFSAQAAREDAPELATAAAMGADFLLQIILGDVDNRDSALSELNAAVSAFLAMTRDNVGPDQAGLPARFRVAAAAALEAGASGTMPVVDEDILNEFLARQPGVLDEIETHVLTLESADDPEAFAEIKRIIHTLKGEAGLLELAAVADACHRVEELILDARHPYPTDGLLAFKDWLAGTMESYGARVLPPAAPAALYELFDTGDAPVPSAPPPPAPEPEIEAPPAPVAEAAPEPEPEPDDSMVMEIDASLMGDFVTEATEHLDNSDVHLLTIETEPQNQDALNAVFRAFHTIKGTAGFLGLNEVQSLAHEAENLLDKARKNELELAGPAIDAVFDSIDALKRMVAAISESIHSGMPVVGLEGLPNLIERIQAIASGEALPPVEKLGKILVESGAVSEDAISEALARQSAEPGKRLGESLVESGAASPREVSQGLRQQQQQRLARSQGQMQEPVKVDATRLDLLIDMIGELVIAETMVSGSDEVKNINSATFFQHMRQLDKITRELQEVGMSLRMVPIRATFQKMARLVRDLGRKSGKKVDFVMTGEDTELDKSVVDKIGDPLVHMVRNAVDHGLEATPEDRIAAGKRAEGRVELRAFHKGGNIYIEIEDDGRGLDLDRIRSKAIERGLINESDNLSERELSVLIFEPGFSTAKEVTDVSGRGVGMDVVRRNIEALRGNIEVQTKAGGGTKVSLRLPLTLAIIDGMVVRVGQERYVIPTLSITRSVRPRREDLPTVVQRGEMLKEQDRLIPLVRLSRLFDIPDAIADPTEALVVVVEDDGKQAGLLTDELLGQHQIVIKSLGAVMKQARGVAGGAIMPDGQVGLILDVGGVIKNAQSAMDEREDGSHAGSPATTAS